MSAGVGLGTRINPEGDLDPLMVVRLRRVVPEGGCWDVVEGLAAGVLGGLEKSNPDLDPGMMVGVDCVVSGGECSGVPGSGETSSG